MRLHDGRGGTALVFCTRIAKNTGVRVLGSVAMPDLGVSEPSDGRDNELDSEEVRTRAPSEPRIAIRWRSLANVRA